MVQTHTHTHLPCVCVLKHASRSCERTHVFCNWIRSRKTSKFGDSSADRSGSECTKIARFSAVAAAIFTTPPQNRAIFEAPRGAICSAKKIASERRFSLRLKGTNLIPAAEFPAIPESAAKIASERRCAILVHSALDVNNLCTGLPALQGLIATLPVCCQGKSQMYRRRSSASFAAGSGKRATTITLRGKIGLLFLQSGFYNAVFHYLCGFCQDFVFHFAADFSGVILSFVSRDGGPQEIHRGNSHHNHDTILDSTHQSIFFSLTEAPLTDPTPSPPNTPETGPKRTQNRPENGAETEPNGAKQSRNGAEIKPSRVGRTGGFVGKGGGGAGGCKEKRISLFYASE